MKTQTAKKMEIFTGQAYVLWSQYWLEYKILTPDDVALYGTLQILAANDTPYTTRWLADEMGVKEKELLRRFNKLEDAELLDINYFHDVWVILREPLSAGDAAAFERLQAKMEVRND